MDRGNGANGASNGGVVRSPMSAGIPVSPASYWSDLTGYQTGSEAGHEHGPRERSASAQSYHSIPSIDRTDDSTESDRGHEDHSAESLVPGQPSLNAQNVAHTGDTTESDGDPETHQPIDEEVSPDELLPGPPSTRQAAVETLLTTQTMTTEVSIRDILNEQAPESETSNTESMPTTQALTTATSIRETSTENDSETISTEISTGQPSDKHGSIESPASGQQANEEPAPVTPVHRRSGHVSPHANRDTPSSTQPGEPSAEQNPARRPRGSTAGPSASDAPPSSRTRSAQTSAGPPSSMQSPTSSQKRRRGSSSSGGDDPPSSKTRKRPQTTQAALGAQRSPSPRRT